jgi:hypothetical protein
MDFNSLTSPIDSEWLFASNIKSGLDDTIEEPVPFEGKRIFNCQCCSFSYLFSCFIDFKFSFGMGPDFSIPLNSDVFPSAPDPFLQEPPSFPPTTVLDEDDQKTFSSFLDTFFMDLDNDQLNDFYSLGSSSNGQEQESKEEESRQCSILQSLDEQKRLARMNVMASLPNKLTSLSPVHPVIPLSSNSDKDMTTSHSEDTPQSIYLLKSDQVTTPYVRATKRSPETIAEVKPVKKHRSTKELLTEEEKKANHIASEQKRRSTIRNGFQDLTDLVPTLKNVNNSKSIILFKAVDFIHHLEKRNNGLREKLHSLQLRAQVEGRMTVHSSHPNTENTEQTSSCPEKVITPKSPISIRPIPLKPSVEPLEMHSTSSDVYSSSKSRKTTARSTSSTSSISISSISSSISRGSSRSSFSSRNSSLSSHTSHSSTSSLNVEGAQASARKALLAHKAQQEQLLKLQEQLQLHQRLIAERQEMKENALKSAKRKTAQYDKSNIMSDLEDNAISAP